MVSFITIVTADDHPTFRDGLRRLLEIEPDLKVIAQANDVADAVPTFGALLRTTQEEVNKRKFGLTPRELEVVSAIVRHSMSNKDIAQFFKIAEDTVKHHVFNSCEKVGASNRLELDHFARAHKLPLKDLF